MSKNPKLTITAAFMLTFLIGVGAGYLFRGEVSLFNNEQEVISRDDNQRRARQSNDNDRLERRTRRQQEAGMRAEQRRMEGNSPRSGRGQMAPPRERGFRGDRDRENPEREQRNYQRIRERIQNEMGLTDETAAAFFEILEEHRNRVKNEIAEKNLSLKAHHHALREELEQRISEVLSEEQLKLWQEKFAPRMDRGRQRRERSDE